MLRWPFTIHQLQLIPATSLRNFNFFFPPSTTDSTPSVSHVSKRLVSVKLRLRLVSKDERAGSSSWAEYSRDLRPPNQTSRNGHRAL